MTESLDRLTFKDMTIELGPQLPPPDTAWVAASTGQLIVARLLDEDGQLMQRVLASRYDAYPSVPSRPDKQATTGQLLDYERSMELYKRQLDEFIAGRGGAEPIPPLVGYIEETSTPTPGYFSLRKLASITGIILPYARQDRPYPYALYTAHILSDSTAL